MWNFSCLGVKTVSVGIVEGFIEFCKLGVDRRIPLKNAPAGKGDRGGKAPDKLNLVKEAEPVVMVGSGPRSASAWRGVLA